MPYDIVYRPDLPPVGRPWKLWNPEKKKFVGSSVSKEMAERAKKARLAGAHGW